MSNPEATTATLGSLADLMAGLQSAVAKTAPVAVPVPELGGTVHVMRMTTAEWLDPEAANALPDTATPAQRRGWSVARWVCDASGQRLVKPDNTAALDLFAAIPWEASHLILQAAEVMSDGEQKNG
jgi:hypothetical protein